MADIQSDFIRSLTERGFVQDCSDTDALDQMAAKKCITAYIGFDCTASSLHAGSLVPIMMLRWLQKTGHKPIVLMGGGTTKIGDPSGKDESRKLLDDAAINANMASIQQIFSRFLTFGDGPTDAVMVNNADWLDALEYIPFLRDYGPHFTINRMLAFDSVKLRLEREQPLTFLEFNYMILQAYDFVELNRRQNCVLQMGGSDQWGNIINGIELARRVDGARVYGLTSPLLTTSSGAKMGKTASGAVWLNEDMLPHFDYWQYWRNTTDADVGRFLKLFTEVPSDEIARIETLEGAELNDAKVLLATEATALARGRTAADEAARAALQTFAGAAGGAELPTVDVDSELLKTGMNVLDLFVAAGLGSSKGEVRRLIKGGGARIDDEVVTDDKLRVKTDGEKLHLAAGKKRHVLVNPV